MFSCSSEILVLRENAAAGSSISVVREVPLEWPRMNYSERNSISALRKENQVENLYTRLSELNRSGRIQALE